MRLGIPGNRPRPVSFSGAMNLFRRARIGVRFHVAPLLVHHPAQFPFHDLEGVVHHFCQRIVRSIIDLFFFCHELMTGREGHINPDPILVSLFVGVVRLLNSNIAPADMITEFVQARRFLQHHLFDSEGFLQAAISDVYWQLHSALILMLPRRQRQGLSLTIRNTI